MDYVQMIKDPELVYGFQQLIGDTDSVVVKRTIKVFTSVYFHALRLLSTRELEAEVFLNAWPSVKEVIDTLMSMLDSCENEGVLIHLVRFIEAAATSHLMYDMTPFPEIWEKGKDVAKRGLKMLKDLIVTPYVGGVSFIVAVRAIINIACLRRDLWEPVTDLLKKTLTSLPPTLFDHNVRSLRKTLQKNLFRLLRRAETPQLKGKLIEMMVSVGVPRKLVVAWAPPLQVVKKRMASEMITDESIVGRAPTPPEKKVKAEEPEKKKEAPAKESRPISPVANCSSKPDVPEVPKDPRIAKAENIPEKAKENNTAVASTSDKKPFQSDFMFLASLLPKAFNKEKELYNVLCLDGVVSLVLEGLDYLPDMLPKSFLSDFHQQAIVSEDADEMRKHLAYMLTKDLTDKGLKELISEAKQAPKVEQPPIIPLTKEEPVSAPPIIKVAAPKSSSQSPPPMDTDMRKLFPLPSVSVKDIDMRSIVDPRLAVRNSSSVPSDPRLPRDPRVHNAEEKEPEDPRLKSSVLPSTDVTSKSKKKSRWHPPAEAKKPSLSDPRLNPNTSVEAPSTSQFPMNTSRDPRFNCPPPSISRDPRFRPNLNVPPPMFSSQHQIDHYGVWAPTNSQNSHQTRPGGKSAGLLPTPMINY